MRAALEACLIDGMSQRAAAVKYDVPRSSLGDKARLVMADARKRLRNDAGTVVDDPVDTYKSILFVSDLHAPYHHPDALRFLAAVAGKYRPDRVVLSGDELDYHAMSFHDSDPDLDAAGAELQKGRTFMAELAALFPVADVLDSNHGSMAYRRAKAHGIPRHLILDYKSAIFGDKLDDGSVKLSTGHGWHWYPDLILQTPHAPVYFHHGKKMRVESNVLDDRMCFVQGHHHSRAEIIYVSTPNVLLWGMTAGCLIDTKSLAFAYNRYDAKRPIISVGVIIDGWPKLVPMPLDRNGNWTGIVP
jgi:hypothetical protein